MQPTGGVALNFATPRVGCRQSRSLVFACEVGQGNRRGVMGNVALGIHGRTIRGVHEQRRASEICWRDVAVALVACWLIGLSPLALLVLPLALLGVDIHFFATRRFRELLLVALLNPFGLGFCGGN